VAFKQRGRAPGRQVRPDLLVLHRLEGVSDILGVLESGGFLAVEVKLRQGRVTEAQEWFISTVQALGGVAGVVRCIPDLEKLLAGLN
jgi:hypothetical protein